MDDTAYYSYADHIAVHPLDPYGFTVFWYDRPQPAHEVLAPPVFLYWWALGIRLFGDTPVLWKLWLWPWCAVFAAAVLALCRRFARPLANPLAWFIVGSPTVLPALNLMLDVPVLALSLAAVALFLRIRVVGSWSGACAVGVLTGLALQTKYTGLVTPAMLAMAAWHVPRHRRAAALLRAALAIGVAAAIFWSWEAFVALTYGSSHFLAHAAQGEPWTRKLRLVWPLVGIFGGVGLPVVMLGLNAARLRRSFRLFAVALLAAGWVALVALSEDVRVTGVGTAWSIANLLFGFTGALALGLMTWGTTRAFRDRRAALLSRFLASWWLVELAGYFVLSPWPAVRRVMGLVLVGTLVFGHRIGRRGDAAERRGVTACAYVSVAFGLLFQVIDTSDALAVRAAVARANALCRAEDPNAEIWYVGHWGLQFYAERVAWKPVVPGESRLPAGTWLAIPDREYRSQSVERPHSARDAFIVDGFTPWPFRTLPAYYGKNKAIERTDRPVVRVRVYRMTSSGVAQPQR